MGVRRIVVHERGCRLAIEDGDESRAPRISLQE